MRISQLNSELFAFDKIDDELKTTLEKFDRLKSEEEQVIAKVILRLMASYLIVHLGEQIL